MFRVLKIMALALLLPVAAASQASAETIIDPIVRTRTGGSGSIFINSLRPPFEFNWGTWPTPPPDTPDDPEDDCFNGPPEPGGVVVTCSFLNNTGEAIQLLNFDFDIPGGGGSLVFTTEDPQELWGFRTIDQFGAQFIGGGIPAFECDGEFCTPFHFFVDLVGFPEGTHIRMAAAAEVPEPMTLTLLATGLALGVGARRRRRK